MKPAFSKPQMKTGTTTFSELAARHRRRLHELAAGDGRKALAASVILLLLDGWDPRRVAQESGLNTTRVVKIRQRFTLLGLAGLHEPAPRVDGQVRTRQLPAPKVPEAAACEAPLEPALAEAAQNLLQFRLAPEHRRRVLVVLEATNPRLTLAEVARRAGVAPSTVSRWWATARREGILQLLAPEMTAAQTSAARLPAVA